ncbi:MAG: DNA-directed RNA polymerase subunit delta [Firmicutes bacterium]|nr:DNA-directed RNA polymerase subunit delta [Bacillota bacterium]
MKLKDMKKEELEVLSYTDLTEMILNENKKPMNTPSVFKKICDLLNLTEEEYSEKIGDYYTSLTTDKRFILLDTAEWDLKDKHKVEIVLDEDDEEEVFDEEEIEEDEELEEMDESVEITDDEVDLDDSDDLEDLSIVNDDEMEEDM